MNYQDLLDKAKEVLENNWTGQFTKPAPNLYPHQWNWDAGFIAIGYAHYDIDKAMAELRSLFRGQWKNGLVPQIVFRPESESDGQYFPGADFWQSHLSNNAPEKPRTSGITMPPVHGFVLWRIYELAEDKAKAKAFLKEMFPKVLALHNYLYTCRDPHDEGLIYVQHPWEPGTDNSPTWDEALSKIDPSKLDIPTYERKDLQHKKAAAHRPTDLDYDRYIYLVDQYRRQGYEDEKISKTSPFLIQDPLFNSILVWSNKCLIEIGTLLGEDIGVLFEWNELTTYMMNEKLWNEETHLYDAWDIHANQRIPIETSSGLMPLIGNIPTQEQAELMLRVLHSEKFSGRAEEELYLCPTCSVLSPSFNPEKYWRGPVWVNMNWLLCFGVSNYDFDKTADQFRDDTLELISKYGFYEYFDPRRSITENAGYGTDQFSWTAALCIDFLMDE